jgi:GDP-L-fucose synthase
MGEAWRARTVLVTGGTGFLGRAVCRKLIQRGADVVVSRSARYDLTKPEDAAAMFTDIEPDIVIHLAARVGGIGANLRAPGELYLSNLLMGTHVIEEARRSGAHKTVLVGTICSYPKFTPVPFREESLWDGYPEETNAPYGIAKKALLVHAQANRRQYGQRTIYLLPTNLYGPQDNFDLATSHVIPALIRKLVEAREKGAGAEVWGTGSPTREFLYVDDAAEGIVLAAEHYDDAEPVNLGSGEEVSIKVLAQRIASLVGFEGELVWDKSKPDGQPRRRLDTSRAERAFGFKATVHLDEGLRRTIDWFLEHRKVSSFSTP